MSAAVGELDVEHGGGSLGAFPGDVALSAWRSAGGAELADAVGVEDVGAGVLEGLDVVGRELGGHVAMVVVLAPLAHIPVDGLEGGAHLPQPPQILPGLLALAADGCRLAVLPQRRGEGRRVGQGEGILLYLPPCHEEGFELRLATACGVVFALEEVARAVGGRFVDNHGHRLIRGTGAGRADDVLGGLVVGLAPESHFGAVDEGGVAAAGGVGCLGRPYLDFAVAQGDVAQQPGVSVAHYLAAFFLWYVGGVGLAFESEHGERGGVGGCRLVAVVVV